MGLGFPRGTGREPVVRRGARPYLLAALVLACVAAALLTPVPGPARLRELAEATGPAMPLVFFAVYALCVTFPMPRTAFSLASGLLLGNALGVLVAMAGTALAALLGFLLARRLRGDLMLRYRDRLPVQAVDQRITASGALGITSLRLIPVIPFAPLSYCCGVSSVRLRPYLVGSVVGSLPGTVAVVTLGDALAGSTPLPLVACYAACALLGGVGVYRMARG
ncbi:TVP38/TMEM64 family protein [Pseudonocardia eucalypti]|uniref:TVP38/TMEM64 family membrane protein n=1 Tax=Pseudonocardia eucalypti TaxID=648755 RepID=A0ABP9RB81_9PSEU|nr:putative membrane protein YdjX (TVP38/TMEM64 family) [Pseudonocardia eucalypti]